VGATAPGECAVMATDGLPAPSRPSTATIDLAARGRPVWSGPACDGRASPPTPHPRPRTADLPVTLLPCVALATRTRVGPPRRRQALTGPRRGGRPAAGSITSKSWRPKRPWARARLETRPKQNLADRTRNETGRAMDWLGGYI
jgi:hypothetical protein